MVEPRRMKTDFVRLPRKRRQAHVYIGNLISVQRAAFVELTFQTKRVENLDFVPTLEVHAAIGPALPTSVRHVRQAKFKVQRVVAIGLLQLGPNLQ